MPPTKPYKAGAAFVIALVGSFVTAITQTDIDNLDWQGWVSILATAVLAGLGTYQISNPPTGAAPATRRAP